MKKTALILGLFSIIFWQTTGYSALPAGSGTVVARASGPGISMRGVPQFFPATQFRTIQYDAQKLPATFQVYMEGIGNVSLPVAKYAGINTPPGTLAFQTLMLYLPKLPPRSQIFVECKDPNGCAVVCNNANGGCTNFEFSGLYRITLNDMAVPSINAPMKPRNIMDMPNGMPLSGKVSDYKAYKTGTKMIGIKTALGFIEVFQRSPSEINMPKGAQPGMNALLLCKDPNGCRITCQDPYNTQCKTALGVQNLAYTFSGQYFLAIF